MSNFVDDCRIPIRNQVFFLHIRLPQILQSGEFVRHGDQGRVVCLRGYEMHGNDKFECRNGVFVQQIGHCRPSMNFISVLIWLKMRYEVGNSSVIELVNKYLHEEFFFAELCKLEAGNGNRYNSSKTELHHNEEIDMICGTNVIRSKCRFGEIHPNLRCIEGVGLFLY